MPSDTSQTRTQRRADANRRHVVDVARRLVAEGGSDALTLDSVAREADVAVQTIYNRVGGRSALLLAVAEQAMEENRAYMDAAYAAEGEVEERLLAAVEAYARFARERPHEFRVLAEPPDDDTAVAGIAALTAELNGRLADAIRDGMAAGVLRDDLDPDRLATLCWATMHGLLSLAWKPGALRADADEIDRLVETYVATFSDGLRRPANETSTIERVRRSRAEHEAGDSEVLTMDEAMALIRRDQ